MRFPALNPVLARELKQRMRARLTWLVITVYLGLLAVILRVVLAGMSQFSGADFGNPFASAAVGRSVFGWLLFFILILVCFIVPGLTAAAISSERERQTLTSLQVTLLSARSIVLGKVLASLAFVSLLVIASLPLISVPFLFGGVSLGEMLRGVAMVLVTAVTLGCAGVAISTVLRRTQAATVVAYGLTLFLVLGTFVIYGAQRAFDGPIRTASPAVLILNPFVATADVIRSGDANNAGLASPFTALQSLLNSHTFSEQTRFDGPARAAMIAPEPGVSILPPGAIGPGIGPGPFGPDMIGPDGGELNGFMVMPRPLRIVGLPFWTASLIVSTLIAIGAFFLASRRLTVPARRERTG